MGMFDKKSGDSKRADEEAARKKDATPEGMHETGRAPETLLDQVQASTDRAKEQGASPDRIAFLEKRIEQLAGIIENLASGSAKGNTGKLDGRRPEELLPKYTMCPTCNQYVKVCGGKHRVAVVLPKNAENMQGFPGVNWNGARYFGTCHVPAAAYDAIMGTVANFETESRNRRHNLGKIRGWEKELMLAQAASAVETAQTSNLGS